MTETHRPPAEHGDPLSRSGEALEPSADTSEPSAPFWWSPVAGIALVGGGGVALFEHTVVRLFDTFDAVAINIVLVGFAWAIFRGAVWLWTCEPGGEAVETLTLPGTEVSESEAPYSVEVRPTRQPERRS